jgi:AcrR family transcriptional regulator
MEMTGSLRARKKAATEAALQDAALRLFVEKGYDATTIEEIVAEADVSRRTFFRYFGSKEEVIFKEGPHDLEALRRLLRERPKNEPALATLKHATVGFVRYLEARRATILQFIAVIRNSPSLNARAAEIMGGWSAAVAEELATRCGTQVDMKRRLLGSLAIAAIAAGVQDWSEDPRVKLDEAVAQAFVPAEEGTLFD